ncbi:phosphotransferase [Bordetella sp. LUAb4]|uniref:phosphotransferase n=1 Tax=Bordetella sp. LUAb4 TaxID=2843195 RepID=UPI00351D49A8
MKETPEIPLTGGRGNAGVVRIGNTVRRPPTPNSDFVSRLLAHLEDVGFAGAPRALGSDEEGRDVVDYLDGMVPANLALHDDAVLIQAAGLIRRYHDATSALVASPAACKVGIEVVCHNDLSPCNFVFRSGLPVGLIDFDAASPGARAYDLGYAVWLWLDLGSEDVEPSKQRRRLALFLDAYGPDGPLQSDVVAAILVRQGILVAEGRRKGDLAMSRWAEDCGTWTQLHLATPSLRLRP